MSGELLGNVQEAPCTVTPFVTPASGYLLFLLLLFDLLPWDVPSVAVHSKFRDALVFVCVSSVSRVQTVFVLSLRQLSLPPETCLRSEPSTTSMVLVTSHVVFWSSSLLVQARPDE